MSEIEKMLKSNKGCSHETRLSVHETLLDRKRPRWSQAQAQAQAQESFSSEQAKGEGSLFEQRADMPSSFRTYFYFNFK